MAKISNEVSRLSIEEVKNRCKGSSSFQVSSCVYAYGCSVNGHSDRLLEEESNKICSGVPPEVLDSYKRDLTNSVGLRKKVVCLTAMKKAMNLAKEQKILKDGKLTALDAEAQDSLEILAASADPELLLLDPSLSIEENFQRVVDQKKDEITHLKNQIEKLSLVDNCLHGFISDPQKCNAQDAYDLLQEENLFPPNVNMEGISNPWTDKKSLVLSEYSKRQQCLYRSRFDQQAEAAWRASAIQDAALLAIPIFGEFSLVAKFAMSIKGLRLAKGLASIANNSKAGGVLMTTWNFLPAIDGAAAAYSSCISSLDYNVRSGVNGKVSMKISTCNMSEIRMEQDKKQCYKDAVFAILGVAIGAAQTFPVVKNSISKLSSKVTSALKLKPVTLQPKKRDAMIAVLTASSGLTLLTLDKEKHKEAGGSVMKIDPRPLKLPENEGSSQSK